MRPMQTFNVSGMSCEHCVRAVTSAIRGIDPGANVQVDLGAGRVTITGEQVPAARLAAAIADEGYQVTG